MAEIIKSSFRGLLVPDSRVTPEAMTTVPSQAGPAPGVPEPLTNTDMVLKSSGSQSASKDLRIIAKRGGFPTLGQAGIAWKNEADASTAYRGFDEYNQLNGWQVAVSADSGTSDFSAPNDCEHPHAITLDSGRVLVAYNAEYAAGTATDNRFEVVALSETTNQWGTPVVVYGRPTIAAGVAASSMKPSLVELPSGRVLLFGCYYKEALSTAAQVDLWFSDDQGATWTKGAEDILMESIAMSVQTIHKMRVAYGNGQLCMVFHVANASSSSDYADAILQYASDDFGNSFAKVDLWPITTSWSPTAYPDTYGAKPDLVFAGNMFIMVYLGLREYSTDNYRIYARSKRTANAFQPFRADTAAAVFTDAADEAVAGNNTNGYLDAAPTPDTFVQGDTAIWTDGTGAVFVIAQGWYQGSSTTYGEVYEAVSYDYGGNWSVMGYNAGAQDSQGTTIVTGVTGSAAEEFLDEWTATAQHGRTVFIHNMGKPGGTTTYKGSLFCGYLGGYSNVTMPGVLAESRATRRVGWDATYIPVEEPTRLDWAAASTGSGQTMTLGAGSFRVQSNAGGGSKSYTASWNCEIENGVMALADFKVTAAPDPSSAKYGPYVQVLLGDGSGGAARQYKVSVYVGTTKIVCRDEHGASDYATVGSLDTTNGIQLLIAARETEPSVAKVSIWYRTYTHGTFSDDRAWIVVPVVRTLTVSAVAADSIVRWGIAGVGADARDSTWYGVNGVAYLSNAGASKAAGFTNPTDLNAKSVGALPTYVNDGVSVAAVDGPAWPADSWKVATRYSYEVGRCHPRTYPSPRTEWRSTGVTSETLEWDLESLIAYDTLGILLEGINWRTATLSGWNESGSTWATLMSLDAAAEFLELPYSRVDDTITVKTDGEAASGTRYIHENEMRDGVVDLGSSKFRTITDNAAGIWRTQDTVQLPSLRIGGADGTEPANGLCNIWAPRLLGVASGVANKYTKLKLVIDAQSTPDGYFTIGSVVIGQAHLLAHDYSWARNLATTTNTQLTTTRDGTRAARVLGPSRRSVAFGWSEPVDVSPISGLYPFPDYYKVSGDTGAAVVASKGNTPATVRGIVEGVDGSAVPVVYLANVPRFEPSSTSLKSAVLNGSAYAVSADATCANFDRTDAFSISFWFRRTTVSTVWHRIIDKQVSTSATGYSLSFYGADPAEVSWRVEDDSTNEIRINTNIDTFDDDAWHHVVCTYDGLSSVNGLAIYVDGIAQAHTQNGTTIASTIQSGTVFRVGGVSGGLLANLDDMTIWGKALDVSEVRRVFNHGTPGSASANLNGNTPLHHWKMGDGDTLPTLTDSGSNPKNLTATNVTFADDAPGYGPGSDIANGVYQTTSRDRFLYGRVLGNVELDTVLGEEDDPDAGELMTIGALTIEEEI